MCPSSLPAVWLSQGTGGRESPKPRPGSQTEVEEDRTDFSELQLLFGLAEWTGNDTNPLLPLSTPSHHFVFTVFAVWCRNTLKREMNWHLTKFSTRKLVSLYIFIILNGCSKDLDEILWTAFIDLLIGLLNRLILFLSSANVDIVINID